MTTPQPDVPPIAFFDGHYYKLLPVPGKWPTVCIDGIQMHRTVRMDPETDALKKVEALRPRIHDIVLDVCTGLGYTAITLAERGCRVVTLEKDPNIMRIARANPFSQPLFDRSTESFPPEPGRIKLIMGDAAETVRTFGPGLFDAVMHDPPRFTIAESLYSAAMYAELFRVLKAGRWMLHYVGNPHRRHPKYKNIIPNMMRRLRDAGFDVMEPVEDIECLRVRKPAR
jgi:predicted methyltransferase